MQALINEKYLFEILEERNFADVDDIRCAYDINQYPNLQDFFTKSFFNKDLLSYKDNLQSFNFQIIKSAFSWLKIAHDDISDEQLCDSVVHDISWCDRKELNDNYAYGHIEIRKVN